MSRVGPGHMRREARERFNEQLDTLIPRLMRLHNSAYRVAQLLGVRTNAVRYWLENNGWQYNKAEGTWREPEATVEPA